jgi:hypothetical protein
MPLFDIGPLGAAFNKADDDHERCAGSLTCNWTSSCGALPGGYQGVPLPARPATAK